MSSAPSALLKVAGAALLSAESLAGAFLPVLLSSRPGALGLASCFGGGVFLAAALLHLLPHCAEQHAALAAGGGGHGHGHGHHHHHHHGQEDREHDDCGALSPPPPSTAVAAAASPPPPYLALVLLGYLLVLAAERVFFENAHDHGHGHGRAQPCARKASDRHKKEEGDDEKRQEEEEEQELAGGPRGRSRSRARTPAKATPSASRGVASPSAARARRGAAAGGKDAAAAPTCPAPTPLAAAARGRGPTPRRATPAKAPAPARRPADTSMPPQESTLTPAGLRSCLVAVLATSVHTLLECAALGLASDRRGFFALLTAIAAHKPASALALSSRFLRAGATPRQAAAYTSLFALVAPAGVAAGALAGGVGPGAELWLSCLSCGAFLYVGLTEVIAEELDGRGGWRSRWGRFGALLAGVASVAAIAH